MQLLRSLKMTVCRKRKITCSASFLSSDFARNEFCIVLHIKLYLGKLGIQGEKIPSILPIFYHSYPIHTYVLCSHFAFLVYFSTSLLPFSHCTFTWHVICCALLCAFFHSFFSKSRAITWFGSSRGVWFGWSRVTCLEARPRSFRAA